MAPYNFKFAFAVVFLVFAGSAFSDDPKPGKWEKGPLKCLTCNGLIDCETPKSLQCLQPDESCVTIFNDNQDKVIKRGCASDLTRECTSPEICFKCVSSNCNKAKSKNDFVECLSCDSSEETKCVTDFTAITNTRKCYKKCMVALYQKDESDTKAGFGLVRSCLDDKKEEDQAKCNSTGSNCKSCEGPNPKCNNAMLPENRLSCFQCTGASCADTTQKSISCPTHKEGDTCVFMFNDRLEFDGAQCKSSLTDIKVNELETAGQLVSCSGNGCNDPKNKPSVPECVQCDSTSNEDCASKPDKVTTFTPCRFNYCFSQTLPDGSTKRGCFADLAATLKPQCTEDKKEGCTQCKENKCNNKVYPTKRRQCYKCNSNDDLNCEGNPNTPITCPTYIEGNKEACATEYNTETKLTKRGCQTELKCRDGNPNCQICKEQDSCNNVNLKDKNSNDPKPGEWEKGPLKCLTCSDLTDCQTSTKSLQCVKPDDPCVTIFDNQDKVIKRGCASDLTRECTNLETCFKCISSNCNKAKSKNDFVECLSCDSSEETKCVTDFTAITNTRKCYKKCMVALYQKDKSDTKAGFGLVRSCLDDKKEEDQPKCGSAGSNCKSCEGPNPKCNNAMLPENRLSCFQCTGASCADTTQKSISCPTHKEGDTCVFMFNDRLEFDGAQCKSSLTDIKVKELETAGQLVSCSGNGCNDPKNKPNAPECLQCDSTSNEDCASKPDKLTTFTRCRFNYCFSQTLADGSTKRGCFADLAATLKPQCTEDKKEGCTQCKENKCNTKIYPKDRRQCYKCNSVGDSNCEGNPTTSVICPKYKEGNKESCVTKFNPETKETKRGCQSEFRCIGNNPKKCQECKDKNTCNIINLREVNGNDPEPGKWQDLPLKCLKCNSENECKTSNVEEICPLETDQCVTVFNAAGIVIKRGCATATKSDCSNEENDCFKCVSNKCNKANDKTKYKSCLSCDTKSNPKCLSDANSIKSTRDCYENCMVALYPRESGPNPSYELVRSCLDDKEENARKCDGSENCKMCSGNNCNHFLYPEKRLKCFQCQGEACKSQVISSYCPTFKQNDACVFVFDESNAFSAAQCKSTLPNSQVEELENAGKLFSCTEDNCNSLEKTPKMPSCLECDSTQNENCATNPEALGTTTTCNFKYCYSQVLDTGATKRGCFSNLDSTVQGLCTEASTGPCTQCKGDNCNKQIYPANRKQCHRCISTKDEKCKNKPDKPGVCPKYVADDSCVTHFEKENKVTKRGCFSEFPCDGKDEKKCQVCKDKDSCNIIDLETINGAMGIYLAVGAVLATLCHLVL